MRDKCKTYEEDERLHRLEYHLDITRSQARLLMTLYKAHKPLDWFALKRGIGSQAAIGDGLVRVLISQVRLKMRRDTIDTDDLGWILSPSGRATVAKALGE